MRLFNNLVGKSRNDFNNILWFYISFYRNVMRDEKNKKKMLIELKELRHDLKISCGIVVAELEELIAYESKIAE